MRKKGGALESSLLAKLLQPFSITKGFCSACHRRRIGSGEISPSQALGKIRSPNILRKESCVEAVARAHRIDKIDGRSRAAKALIPALCESPFLAQLDHQQRHAFRQS